MKIINVIIMVSMVVFAFLQWNDPDSLLWILIYGYVAVIAGLTLFEYNLKWFILAGILCYAMGIIFLIPGFVSWLNSGTPSITGQMKAESPFIEVIREFIGLVIALAVMVYLYYYDRSVRRKPEG